ncbi:molybdopterin-dependent oxidoreductase [Rhodoferax sp.]|uniref:nitrate reductase n=1 Tax=Rhodoferax sp. TaxID=50421 RepID=UPI002851648E|nr:molybdopterin-dependent oxidoreductase [Rhodoferax sp.]MDR3367804.1 molybdopterin-dependent oxidoreductase [Rhodoferax sp.]
MTETRSTCPYCGVGCGVIIESDGRRIIGIKGDPHHPANFGRLCTKGSTLAQTASADVARQTRLLAPQLRTSRGAVPQPVNWSTALDHAAERLSGIVQQHGADALGVYVSGQLLTEDYYVFNKLVKGVLGTNQIDTNSRLCMSSAVAGYKLTLGMDAPPACYDDVNHAQTLFIAGSNAAWAHPILFRRIEDAKARNPAMKIIVADPRRTDTASIADLHLPLQPGTDVALFHGLLHIMLWEGWTDNAYIAAHTNGFDALKALVRDFTPDHVASLCRLPKADLFTAARWFAGVEDAAGAASQRLPTLSLYCQGLNQSSSGTAKNAALINLHLATGQIGQPGAGPFSLTGQPNAMGGREVGGLANLLSAHRDLANPAHRAEVAALWGVDSVPQTPGRTAIEMFQAAADGEVKALWIACTNPAQSLPDQATVRRALQRAEFVIVQEAFATTATCNYADLLLPATTWGEKDGTMTNSERRISRMRAAVPAPTHPDFPHDGPRDDWRIAQQIGQRLETVLRPGQPTLLPYADAQAVWLEHRETTRGRDLDITGLSYALLDAHGPQQWPCPEAAATTTVAAAATPGYHSLGQARLYVDGRFHTPDGRARFAAVAYKPVAEARVSAYPFSLNTGRLRDQWHGMSRTGTLGRLFGHVPEPVLQMHPQDMSRRGFADGDLVRVSSKRGTLLVPVQASEELALTQVFMAMHWGSEVLSGQGADGQPLAGVNALTTSAYCPSSKQPEFKHAAVQVEKADLPWTLLALAWLPSELAHTARAQLVALMPQLDFATCVPFGRERTGVLFRAAHRQSPGEGLLCQVEAALGLDDQDILRYSDTKRGQRRALNLKREDGKTLLEGFMLAGDTRAQAWITTLLKESLPAQQFGPALLAPGATPPVPVVSQGQQVCTCFNVSDVAIQKFLSTCRVGESDRLVALQASLRCGTNCGSCVPQLQRLVRQVPVLAALAA